ncbi:hypothetical protein NLG97_g599 [Lecanicillium saksenae]|uniref:Uncharacterized protein n=1 Tax=Lecanicillium saksenae TaxID=468837 RepID=A0ACC1R825_9HYPO|nr:hypothetical protein NLG97_g599 [Lecanicillium saksenae]
MKTPAAEALEMRESIKKRLRNIHGLYFFDKTPMTGRDKRDNDIIDALQAEAPSGPVGAETWLAHLILASNCTWPVLLARGPDYFWSGVGETKGGKLSPGFTRDLVLAIVRARQRFLCRFPQKGCHDVDTILVAYTQHLLEKFQDCGKMMFHGAPVSWRLPAQEIQAVAALTPHGPVKELSRNKFELAPSAKNLLVPARCLSPIGKFKHNLMGLAEEIIQQSPWQREQMLH